MGNMKQIVLFLTLLCISWSRQSDNVPSSMSVGDQDRLAHAINDFGYRLTTKMMKQNENNNIVISPVGIAGLLAMTLLGSTGMTYDELAQTLGFSQDILENRRNHEQLGELLVKLTTNSSSRTVYADAIFVDDHTQLRDVYRDYLQRVYRGDALDAPFKDTVKATQLVNDWVKNHTNGKIEDFLKQPLSVDTKVVLLSALYFSGQWEKPFVPDYTREMQFTTPTKPVVTNLMLNLGKFNYKLSVKDGLQLIALPYNDSTTTMYILKPRQLKTSNLSELMDRIDYKTIDNLINEMTNENCVIRFPKMDLKSKVDLEDSLKALGVKSMFSPKDANFALMIEGNKIVNKTEEELITRINTRQGEARSLNEMVNGLPNPGVYVDSVLHDVKITINEYGTEAVAATSGILARSAEQFYADSPFYMFIRNEKTKLVTFSAAIFDPTI